MDWAAYLKYLQAVLKEFDTTAALPDELLIQYLWDSLNPSIRAQLDKCNRNITDWQEVIEQAIDAEAKINCQALSPIRRVILTISIVIGQQKESLRTRRTPRFKKPLTPLLLIKIVLVMARLASQAKPWVGVGKKALISGEAKMANLLTLGHWYQCYYYQERPKVGW